MNRLLFFLLLLLLPIFTLAQTAGALEEAPSSEARFPGCERGLAYEDKLSCADNKMNAFFLENSNIPDAAIAANLSGSAVIQFIIEVDGTLADIKLISATDPLFEEEAVRLAHLLPNFIPAKKGAAAVRTRKEVVIDFVVERKKDKKKGKKKDIRRDMAKQRIEQLKEGVLLVRLRTNTNKIAALERLAEESSMGKRAEYREMLNRALFVRDSVNTDLMTYFTDGNYFNFCEVYFFFDDETNRYAEGEKSGYFIDQNFEVDPSITLEDRPSFMTYIGTTPISEDARTVYTAFVIKDENLSPLSPPFPAIITFRKKVGGEGSKLKHSIFDMPLPDAVEKLNARLQVFYETVKGW